MYYLIGFGIHIYPHKTITRVQRVNHILMLQVFLWPSAFPLSCSRLLPTKAPSHWSARPSVQISLRFLYFHIYEIVQYLPFLHLFLVWLLRIESYFKILLCYMKQQFISFCWENYQIIRMEQFFFFFIHSSFNERLGCFQVLAITNKSLCGHMHSYLLDKYLMALERLEQEQVYVNFLGSCQIFPKVVRLFPISASTV